MKRNLFILMGLFLSFYLNAQQKTNIVLFTEGGEKFFVILNGVQQNEKPETNVKITDLMAPNYHLKIKFDNHVLGEITKNITFEQGTEVTYVIKKNNKGNYIVRYMNQVPIPQGNHVKHGQRIIVYSSVPPATTTITQTQTTTVTNGNNSNPGNVSIGINANDNNVNINLNTNGNSNQSTTTTTTTTTTTNMQHSNNHHNNNNGHHNQNSNNNANVLPGYKGEIGCPYPMSKQDFDEVKQSISSKSFEDSKLTIAKQVINSNCLLCSQVKEIMLLFTFESTRLELAKYAYGYTYDLSNYYKLNDAFTFESSIDELNKYIKSYHK